MAELLRIESFDDSITFSTDNLESDLKMAVTTNRESGYIEFDLSDEQARKIIDTFQTFLINKIKKP